MAKAVDNSALLLVRDKQELKDQILICYISYRE